MSLKIKFYLPAALLTVANVLAASYGNSALLNAAESGDVTEVGQLLDNGENIEQTNDSKTATALIIAVQNNNEALVRLLVSRGANVNATTTLQTPLQNAMKPEIAKVLVELGANVNQVHNDSTAFLMSGSTMCDKDMVRTYAELGADFSLLNSRILSACLAQQNGSGNVREDLPFLKYLVSKGARVQESPDVLYVAAGGGADKIVQYLISQGAQPNTPDSRGWLPLNGATKASTVGILLKAGANPQTKDNDGVDALMSAASECNVEKFSLVLKAGGDVNTTDKAGRSIDQALQSSKPRAESVSAAALKKHRRSCDQIRRLANKAGKA